ncbi:hypothetical protein [Kitasatospora aureofaciens]|uniref:hypothetical protein n=1 Tax=Kitasatospora aureofaciens TaxID=1894 RepID=UPI001C4862EC|nr:hypothetical protein [Kitasatospora aureofaciens]MBV6701696.1 hypothetical protein [Kitasatospora aureofaciens]
MRKSIVVAAVLICLAVPGTASASPAAPTDSQANVWMDTVLNDMRLAVSQHGLDPMVMAPFNFKVKKTGITNRDLKANFTRGSLYGLAGIHRQGDCTYETSGADMRLDCYVSLQALRVLMNADVKGDSITGNHHDITTSSIVPRNTLALLEFQGKRGHAPNLMGITVHSVTLTSSVTSGKLDLNKARQDSFFAAMNQNISTQIVAAAQGHYAQALRSAITRQHLP